MPTTRRATDIQGTHPVLITRGGEETTSRSGTRHRVGLAPKTNDVQRGEKLPDVGRARRGEKNTSLGLAGEKQRDIGLSQLTGQFTIAGEHSDQKTREALAIYGAAELIAAGTDIASKVKSTALREKMLGRLEGALAWSLEKRFAGTKEKAFAGSMTVLGHLARAFEKSDRDLFHRAVGSMLTGLERVRDREMLAFYLAQLGDLEKKLSKTETTRLDALQKVAFPEAPLVEKYTANRTKPLEVRHHIHPEFWKEELAMFTKKAGWELVSTKGRDSERVYRGKLKDPTGKKQPLEVNLIVKKGELDYLETMSDPSVHMISYSGHSSVGGNGSEAIEQAPAMKGEHPKLVFAANCRGKDNYVEFTNKWPGAHVIMTIMPTYSENGQSRLAALFDTLAAGRSYSWMRGHIGETFYDEPATNYFYPDEMRKFRFMDADEDGFADDGVHGRDRLFDVDARLGGVKFDRALAFANSELFYHWEVDAENGQRSHYGRAFGDSLEAAGPFFDGKPGELVRVKREGKKFLVSYSPEIARKMDGNLLAAHVTMHAVMALAKAAKGGELTQKEALRSALMGAQAIHYLDVFSDSSPITYKKFFAQIGITDDMDEDDIERVFEKFDAHANDAHVEGFEKMLAKEYGFDLSKWTPKFRRSAAHVDAAV